MDQTDHVAQVVTPDVVCATGYGCYAQWDGQGVRLGGTTSWGRLALLGCRAREGELVVPTGWIDSVQLQVSRTALRRRLVVRSRLGMWRLYFPLSAARDFERLMDGVELAMGGAAHRHRG